MQAPFIYLLNCTCSKLEFIISSLPLSTFLLLLSCFRQWHHYPPAKHIHFSGLAIFIITYVLNSSTPFIFSHPFPWVGCTSYLHECSSLCTICSPSLCSCPSNSFFTLQSGFYKSKYDLRTFLLIDSFLFPFVLLISNPGFAHSRCSVNPC